MKLSFFCLALAAAVFTAVGSGLTVSVPFDPSAVTLSDAGPYTTVFVEGAKLINQEGLPALPELGMRVALPTGTVADAIEIVSCEYTELRGRHLVMPAGPVLPLSVVQEVYPVSPDPHIYGLSTPYPFEPVRLAGSGVILGIPVADIYVYPVRWNPASGRIEVLSSLTIDVSYHSDPEAVTILRRSAQSEQRSQDIVRANVVNPDGVSASGAMIVASRDLAYGEYVIITHPDYQSTMQELADWKTAKGVPTNVYTTTWIQSQYSCYDLQQEIRAFLYNCRLEGAEYILIVGDDDKVACRDAIISAGSYTEYAPVDLYFADNNDTGVGADRWDSNGNHIWGETSDAVDWHPDFWVGRASVNSVGEAALYIDKVLIYEHMQAPPGTDYFETAPTELRIGYTTGILWYSPYCPGSASAEIISGYVPSSPTWEEEKLNEGTTGNSTAMTIAMINAGPHHVYHASHGSETSMYTANGDNFTAGQIMNLTNMTTGDNVAIWNSIACLIGALDTGTCCGDAWNNSTNGGGFGSFNSRYGWGTPSSPGNGPSEVICERFYYEYYNNDIFALGAAHGMALDHFCPPSDAYMNWSIKEYNLLGDPELPMWTNHAADMTVSHPASIPGAGNVTVTVNGTSGPLQGARVCLQKGNWQTGEVYEVGTTNASGQVTLYVAPASAGSIDVTVWAHDYDTYQGTITCGVGIEGDQTGVVTGLGSIYPSPALQSATMAFSLGSDGPVSIRVFDLTGRVVAELADTGMSAGDHSLVWDLSGSDGRTVPAGVYCVRFEAPGCTATRNLVVVR